MGPPAIGLGPAMAATLCLRVADSVVMPVRAARHGRTLTPRAAIETARSEVARPALAPRRHTTTATLATIRGLHHHSETAAEARVVSVAARHREVVLVVVGPEEVPEAAEVTLVAAEDKHFFNNK